MDREKRKRRHFTGEYKQQVVDLIRTSGKSKKQNVRYILRARRSRSSATEVVRTSLELVDEAVAALARSTYERGSTSTHSGRSNAEVRNLKRYVEAVLAELLEIA